MPSCSSGATSGRPTTPAWALNLETTPEAVVQIGQTVTPVVAQLVTDPVERDQVWAQMIDIYPGYAMYRSKTGRDIKVFAVRPVDPQVRLGA